MADPSLADGHIDSALNSFSRAYFQDTSRFAWQQFAPRIMSPKQSDRFFVFDKDEWLRTDAAKRAPNTEAAVRTYSISNDSYFADVYSIAVDVSEQQIANFDDPLDAEADAARLAVEDLNRRLDVDMAAAFFAASIWGTDNATKNWADAASDPLGDISIAVRTILQNTGFKANTLLLGPESWYGTLDNHPDLLARLPDNQARILTPSVLGQMAGLNVIVADSIRNTAAEGLTGSYSFNFTDHALVAYIDPNPGPRTATAAASFNWTGLIGSEGGIQTKRIEMPWQDAMPRVEVSAAIDFKVIGSDLGYFFSDVSA